MNRVKQILAAAQVVLWMTIAVIAVWKLGITRHVKLERGLLVRFQADAVTNGVAKVYWKPITREEYSDDFVKEIPLTAGTQKIDTILPVWCNVTGICVVAPDVTISKLQVVGRMGGSRIVSGTSIEGMAPMRPAQFPRWRGFRAK